MKIALVHDFLREYGGAERVVEALHEMWPDAPLYTSFVDWKSLGVHAARFKNWDIRPSWVQHNWIVRTFHSPLRFLAPRIWESFDLSAYDVVITSSGWFMCRGVALRGAYIHPAEVANENLDPHSVSSTRRPSAQSLRESEAGQNFVRSPQSKSKQLHICYIHHPPRNLYGYATGSNLQKYWPVRVYAMIINFFLRHYDFETAQRVDYFVANSKETARRVQKFYRRESRVIYPPATQAKPRPPRVARLAGRLAKALRAGPPENYFLSVGRLTYAKRVDVIIQACNTLTLPLKVVGKGKEEEYLRSIAGPTIEFMGGVSDDELDRLYAGAKACIFCALDEDFGIVPVEAMAHGVPVIALAQGGVLETVVNGKTGILFFEPTVDALVTALKHFDVSIHRSKWKTNCIAQAKKFSKDRFQKEFREFIEKNVSRVTSKRA